MTVYCQVCWGEIIEEGTTCPTCGVRLRNTANLPFRNRSGQLVLTRSLRQRLLRLFSFDPSALHDIRQRDDLIREKYGIVFVSWVLITLARIQQFSSAPVYILYSTASTIVGSLSFLSFLVLLGSQFQGPGPRYRKFRIFQTLVYLYPLFVLDLAIVLAFIKFQYTLVPSLLLIIFFFYTYNVLAFMLQNLFHTGEIGAILSLAFTVFGWLLIELVLYVAFLSLKS